MKKLSSLLLVLIFCNCSGNSQQKEDSDYISEVNAYFKTLNNERKNNYLQLIALYPLKEGSNTFGKDSLNDLIVNFGDLIQIWSKNKIKATSHRVLGNDKERFSIPFFFNPQFDTVISEADGITAGKYLSNRYNNTYSHQKIKTKI